MRNSDYVIHITTKHGRTWTYLKDNQGWTKTGAVLAILMALILLFRPRGLMGEKFEKFE